MIKCQHINLMRGTKDLFIDASVTFNPGEKIGLIGNNGSGKTSLFALLTQAIFPDGGNIDIPSKWRIASVQQEIKSSKLSALEYTCAGDNTYFSIKKELSQLEASSNNCGEQIAMLHEKLDEIDAYSITSRAQVLLNGLGFSEKDMQENVDTFSGGYRMRLNLAQALMCPSDLLLLDEPTNHLDLDAILWLEDYLKRYTGTLIVISHDRDFLDRIAQVIVHIDQHKLIRYTGNYSDFEKQRAARLAFLDAQIQKQQKRKEHLERYISRFRFKATKAKQAQSRIKMLNKMQNIVSLTPDAEFNFSFLDPESSPNPLLVAENLVAGYTQQKDATEKQEIAILKTERFALQLGERIGILGVNGAGKSTFIKTLVQEIKPLSGTLIHGKGLRIGYFAQNQITALSESESPLWHLNKIASDTRELDLRNFLGQFRFSGDMATTPIKSFSGGEKARLALALIVWQKPNLLVLDEPTNHLDLSLRQSLTEALAQYEGTLILVSHDRHLLKATVDRFYLIGNGKLTEFDGDLDDYRNYLLDLHREVPNTTITTDKEKPSISRKEQKRAEAENRQRLSNLRKPIEKQIATLEKNLATFQERKSQIDISLSDQTLYDTANKEKLRNLLAEQGDLIKKIASIEDEWLSLQESLEQVS